MFKEVPAKVSFPEVELRILELWRERDVFRRSVELRRDATPYVHYDGPPTANGRPHIGHVLTRVFKDLFPRYKTMRGYLCERKAGWDTHGLPVEIEVEKELGFSGKQAIEEYGVAAFNAKCRESVFRYVEDWRRMVERVGHWIDLDDPYVTLHNSYVESVWWTIKSIWDQGHIYQDYKVVPYCSRCGTSLSSHEVALGYDETEDPSIYVKFELLDDVTGTPADGKTFFLVWTTTPWTLPGNVALALHPDLPYVLVESEGERLILAEALVPKALTREHRVIGCLGATDLVGKRYRQLYPFLKPDRPAHFAVAADFVTAEDGTGIVHIAPAFGEDDMRLARHHNLPVLETVDLRGEFIPAVTPWAGKFVKDADPGIITELESRGLMYRHTRYTHTYPFCWRCSTPLLYYAKTTWFARRSAIRDKLLANNAKINWYPEHLKNGRFGNFLDGIIDWALARERYWGTPLPIWVCESCDAKECFGGLKELQARAAAAVTASEAVSVVRRPSSVPDDLDLHRPFVDEVTLTCKCGGVMRRVPEVLDAWWDSGAMPYGQWGYPHRSVDVFQRSFPADFICEAIDQTRGWFLSLHVLSSFLFEDVSFKNVVCLELVLDAEGEKMSKSKGNVVDPWSVMNVHGADALRWYLITAAPPYIPRRFSAELVGEALRKFMLTLWNTYSFFVIYANLDDWTPSTATGSTYTRVSGDGATGRDGIELSLLDRWILSELHRTVREVRRLLDDYDPTGAGRAVESFVDDLSNWYVRRGRRRFWKSESDADKAAAYATLHECLVTVAKLIAPMTPFLAEELYQNLVRSHDESAPDSVHHCDFPEPDESLIDEELSRGTRLVMRVVSLGRAARSKAAVKVRQPLGEVVVCLADLGDRGLVERLGQQVLDELNVEGLQFADQAADLLSYSVRPNLKVLGPRLGKQLNDLRHALPAVDGAAFLRAQRTNTPVEVAGITLAPEEYEVLAKEREGYAVAEESGYVVALKTEITPDLLEKGLAREIVHRIQNLRKSASFRIEDRIVTYFDGDADLTAAIERFADTIKAETLSDELQRGPSPDTAYSESLKVEGKDLTLAVERR